MKGWTKQPENTLDAFSTNFQTVIERLIIPSLDLIIELYTQSDRMSTIEFNSLI